jgi:hypothetical protein
MTANVKSGGEVNLLVWRWHGEVCVPQARAIWPESQAWLGCGMAITLGPSLRSSIGVTLFASIQGAGASPYRKKPSNFCGTCSGKTIRIRFRSWWFGTVRRKSPRKICKAGE